MRLLTHTLIGNPIRGKRGSRNPQIPKAYIHGMSSKPDGGRQVIGMKKALLGAQKMGATMAMESSQEHTIIT